jgi:hypothetical protein
VLLNLFYEVARAVVVTLLFAEHGVNGIYYLAFCLFFAVFFGLCTFRLVIAFVDGNAKNVAIYAVLTAVTFFAPDTYVVIASKDVPGSLYIALAGYLAVTVSVTVYSLVRKVKKQKTSL